MTSFSLPRPAAGVIALSGWRRDLLAAAAVEAACGVAAAAWVNACRSGHEPFAVFFACTVAAAAADMVLVPGCVWARQRVALRLPARAAAAALTLAAAVWLAIWSMVPLFGVAGVAFSGMSGDGPLVALLAVPFLVAGTVAGLGAGLADLVDAQPGVMRARWRSHMAGGLFGVAAVLALAFAAAWTDGSGATRPWWPLLVVAPAVLVAAGGLRNGLMARDAVRTGTTLAQPGDVAWPALACCALCLLLAAAAALAPASLVGAAS